MSRPSSPQQIPVERDHVFISHASPENNDFVGWLGGRLGVLGYNVWSDLTKLTGGEVFWQDIENAIKIRTAVFVVVMSHASHAKEGVLREIKIAKSVSEKLGVAQFVLPVKLDTLPHRDFPGSLQGIHAIDFSDNWANGISQLLNVLDDLDVPKDAQVQQVPPHTFRLGQERPTHGASESLSSNWFEIASLPPHINLLELRAAGEHASVLRDKTSALIGCHRNICASFSNLADLKKSIRGRVVSESQIPVKEFLASGYSGGPQVSRHESRKIVCEILNQGWKRFAEEVNLREHALSGQSGWFFSVDQDKERVRTLKKRKGWRKLAGSSQGRFWHYGVTPFFVLASPMRIEMRAHVIFSKDGSVPPGNTESTVRLRRGFCKNWWNPHWRDLVRNFAEALAGGQECFQIPLGESLTASIRSTPIQFHANFSIHDPKSENTSAPELDPVWQDDHIDEGMGHSEPPEFDAEN